MITINDLNTIEVRIGTICTAERILNTEKLLRLMVDFGESELRQIISGIAAYSTDLQELVGKQCAFVTNLAPHTIRGLESNGMLFAVGEGDTFALLIPNKEVPPGTRAH